MATDVSETGTPRIYFRTNIRKALEVIVWCAQKRETVDFHTVLKVLFGADLYHLNKYGRPIVGDTYSALDYGPVPQTTYDLLKREPLALEELGTATLPFEVEGSYRVRATRPPDLSLLSRSDIEALEDGWRRFGRLGFADRTRESHQHPAWRNARAAGVQSMDYADFLEGENATPDAIADLAEVASALRL
jgi:uncharacterized phage-associated protein